MIQTFNNKKIENSYLNKKNLVISFFLPLWPLKVFSNISAMATLSLLIALRVVLQYASIHIPTINLTISISWTPLMIIGWIYGPLFGLVTGAITDSICFLIKPTTWFWLYAIQEPMVGFICGTFGYLCTLRLNSVSKKPKSKKWDFIMLQIFLITFVSIGFMGLYMIINDFSYEGKKSELDSFFWLNSKWLILGSILFFFISMEISSIILLKKFNNQFVLVCWIVCMVCFMSILMSFILGPISSNEYYKFLYGKDSPSFVKYGITFYLVPRAIKESFKAPIQIILLVLTIPIAVKTISEIKHSIRTKWNKKYK